MPASHGSKIQLSCILASEYKGNNHSKPLTTTQRLILFRHVMSCCYYCYYYYYFYYYKILMTATPIYRMPKVSKPLHLHQSCGACPKYLRSQTFCWTSILDLSQGLVIRHIANSHVIYMQWLGSSFHFTWGKRDKVSLAVKYFNSPSFLHPGGKNIFWLQCQGVKRFRRTKLSALQASVSYPLWHFSLHQI